MHKRKIAAGFLGLLFLIVFSANGLQTQKDDQAFTLTTENLQDGKTIELDKLNWKYQPGDDLNWASPDFDDGAWEQIKGSRLNPKALPQSGWNGRGWFRLRFDLDEKLADKYLALIMSQGGASEVYLDGRLVAEFGDIKETGEREYNPNRLPIPFKLDRAGEHVLAVRYSSARLADVSQGTGRWLASGGASPGFSIAVSEAFDLNEIIVTYAGYSSMRGGFFFVGFLLALALLHFLLYIFYRVERANLFYSFFALAFAISIVCGNLRAFGHQGTMATSILYIVIIVMRGVTFAVLPAFLLVAFRRPFGKIFWALTALWIIGLTLHFIFLNQYAFTQALPSILIGLSFTYIVVLLINSLRQKRPGAWILFGGVFTFQMGMLVMLLAQMGILKMPADFYFLAELAILLGVPIAVSIFLARNFARTNQDLQEHLIEVERLSKQQIEHERHAAELRAENERRTQELEEARQLQLSMLPARVPQLSNLEIAAYMKPATEVGGDYYDFHSGDDGTLTIAVGDATGHGLKAGTVVTATKGLFINLAPEPDIPDTFRRISRSLKAMNLRGLYMALTILKFKDNQLVLSSAGMPSILIYRDQTKTVEEISIRAMPLGSITGFEYRQRKISLTKGDTVVLMSDGFPEMFNEKNELLGYDKAETILLENSELAPQELINLFVETAGRWGGNRAPDDDVTFVVSKMI